MIIVLLGPPGAGKGTQGERLAARLDVPKIATGDVLRAAVKEGTPLGLEAKAAMDRGDLVPDAVIMGIMKEALAAPSAAKGAILDGVVRTTPQAAGLNDMLVALGRPLDAVLLFEVDEDELVRRLSGRTTCEACQRPFFGRQPGETCTEGGVSGTLVRRKDDEPEAIRKRMEVYREQTSPVIHWYEKSGANLVRVDAIGTLEEVEGRVLSALRIS
ncbi:MAG TPA: adenylate kinase [Gemmatimonas aurantiaca]|uniref:Adenylate kinase n=2 Tax=Gemmatimonas aurantiaca TaxID=173480 RepID=KAD_GEMAT|nr:adenylate kinase [Gemmatimonas aurantiaca]C1A6S6.1 RecName: Full=Adenylate kinase; Short=AK; AltName: Full=ATP-AMP transphosphorylase; AltName: Full=ATP:AMP phosphotransferase; AltName: Full=Adenylate monophosphate kinase [Gemmatimonas aurantiaca T-27]BAH37936.1 adenylate kinase [Gemmatimonas aurantiaca T-27]HCT56713.1 adenylate kinase [Gemmatimonas aurantiaca]